MTKFERSSHPIDVSVNDGTLLPCGRGVNECQLWGRAMLNISEGSQGRQASVIVGLVACAKADCSIQLPASVQGHITEPFKGLNEEVGHDQTAEALRSEATHRIENHVGMFVNPPADMLEDMLRAD